MSKIYAIDALNRPLGRFPSQKTALAAAGEGGFTAEIAEDILDKQTKAQMMHTCAYLAARVETPAATAEELDDSAGNKLRNDPGFATPKKKTAIDLARELFSELETAKFPRPKKDGDAAEAEKPAKRPRVNVKDHLRSLFAKVGVTQTEAVMAKLDDETTYTHGSVITGVSDLKNEKYSNGPTMVLDRQKAEDGTISYTRTA